MCRNIRPLFNYAPPTTEDEVRGLGASIRPKSERLRETFAGERGSI